MYLKIRHISIETNYYLGLGSTDTTQTYIWYDTDRIKIIKHYTVGQYNIDTIWWLCI